MSSGLTGSSSSSTSQSGKSSSSEHPGHLHPFRFGFKFDNVSSYFKRSAKPSVFASDSVTCAGVQYRLLLSLEQDSSPQDGPSTTSDSNGVISASGEPSLRALLQKSKGRGPPVSYSIYAYDHRMSLEHQTLSSFLEPITTCHADGEGYANAIPLSSMKSETGDSIFLTIALEF